VTTDKVFLETSESEKEKNKNAFIMQMGGIGFMIFKKLIKI